MTSLKRYTPLLRRLEAEAKKLHVKIEVMISCSKSESVQAFGGVPDAVKYSDSRVLGVRVVTPEFSEGCAFTERINTPAALQALHEALENAAICKPSYPVKLKKPPRLKKKINFFNPELDKIELQKLIDAAISLEKSAAQADARILNVPYAAAGRAGGATRLYNSLGLDVEEESNQAHICVSVLSGENDLKRSASAFACGRDFAKLDTEAIARRATRDALDLLAVAPMPFGSQVCCVFAPEAAATILSAFASLFSAKNVLEGHSLFAGKKGETIAAPSVTLIDDPLRMDATSSQNFDAEGYPSRKITLIDKGVLKNFLHNSVTAAHMGERNNARAARSPKSSLSIAPTNWVVKCANTLPLEKLMALKPQVIEILDVEGIHSGLNPVSGDFSIVGHGFACENGKRRCALKPFTISGNFIEMLKAVIGMGKNSEVTSSDVITGSLCIDHLSIN